MNTHRPFSRLAKSLFFVIGFTWSLSASAEPFAYINNFSDSTVSVIDTATNTVVDTIGGLGSLPFGVAVHPHGNTVYVTNNNSSSVSVIDATTNTVVATVAVGSGPKIGRASCRERV